MGPQKGKCGAEMRLGFHLARAVKPRAPATRTSSDYVSFERSPKDENCPPPVPPTTRRRPRAVPMVVGPPPRHPERTSHATGSTLTLSNTPEPAQAALSLSPTRLSQHTNKGSSPAEPSAQSIRPPPRPPAARPAPARPWYGQSGARERSAVPPGVVLHEGLDQQLGELGHRSCLRDGGKV
eukprot:scaffold12088_cov98-Isochrysis_galbana.AAC.1